jgi:transcriptional regulator with XRE-family HTH domain
MTLRDYYDSLERPVPPKKEFIRKVAERCGVDDYTVRIWINGKSKPSKDEYYQILSEESGIPVEKLFDDVH